MKKFILIFSTIFLFCSLSPCFAATSYQKGVMQKENGRAVVKSRARNVKKQTVAAKQKVNLNKANVEALSSLKRVGERKAEAIVEYRNQHGDFKSVNELVNVKGISQRIIDENRDRLTVG